MAISIKVKGVKRILAEFKSISRKVENAIKNSLDETAAEVQALARSEHPKVADRITGSAAASFRRMTGPKAGEFAFKPRFLTRTGILRQSIKISRARKTLGGDIEATVFTAVKYGNDVEFGTVKTPAYPFLRPALNSATKKGQARLSLAIRRALG